MVSILMKLGHILGRLLALVGIAFFAGNGNCRLRDTGNPAP
jgi:hypothetical protein